MEYPKGFVFNGWNMIDGRIYANMRLTKWSVIKLEIKALLTNYWGRMWK